jgi:EmrB/QacA subfamily drug resistance transporter
MDSTVIATSLPAIASSIGTSPVALKLALTTYLLALAVFIPVSGWAADRFGPNRLFGWAIVVFMVGSVACAASSSLAEFVAARFVQGMGGAMMTPVARLVMLRSTRRSELVQAMAWLTMPALVGPLIGPPLGGFLTTYASWHWIFLINVPIGCAGIALAARYLPVIPPGAPVPLDRVGFLLSAIACSGLIFGFSVAGLDVMPTWVPVTLVCAGFAAASLYVVHARFAAWPLLDLTLLRITTFRSSVIGGSLFRIGVGAVPFLLPLMLQVGFGYTPFESGVTTFAAAAGAIGMKVLVGPILRAWGFRTVLACNAALAAVFIAINGLFTIDTPQIVIAAVLLVGGFFRSLQFTSINAIAFADVDNERLSRATSLSAVVQQFSLSLGVATAAGTLEIVVALRGGALDAPAFSIAFFVVAAITAVSALVFAGLPRDAGAEVAGRLAEGAPRQP